MTQPHSDVSDQQLFWGADQYDFSVVLQAEALECFWHFAHKGENFYLNFMVRLGSSELISNIFIHIHNETHLDFQRLFLKAVLSILQTPEQ